MKKYKLYLFDFDGTLFNTIHALEMVFKETYAQLGVMVTDEECLRFSREPIDRGYIEKGLDITKFWDFVDIINFYLNGHESVSMTEPFEDTVEFHKLLKESGAMSGIVTSNNIPHCKDIYEYHNIDCSFMNVFVGNHECITPKPDPAPILKALEMLNYQGELSDVVYVGDSKNDCLAAKNAHIETYLLDRDNKYNGNEYQVIHSLLELFQ